jgi:hypothetical protein
MADDLLVTDEALEDPLVLRRLLSDIIERLDDDVNSVITDTFLLKTQTIIQTTETTTIKTILDYEPVTKLSGGDSTTPTDGYNLIADGEAPTITDPVVTIPAGFVNVAEITSLNTSPYPFTGSGVAIILKPSAAAQPVPADWTGYTGYPDIETAIANSTAADISFIFPNMPVIPKYGNPTIFNATTVSLTANPQLGKFDPLDEYPGDTDSWTTRVVGFFHFPFFETGWTAAVRFLTFGGEAGSYAFFNDDIPEWIGIDMVAGDDVYIKLSNV